MPGAAPGPIGAEEAVHHDLDGYRLSVATRYGPRVAGLRLGEGPEMLAALSPDVVIDRPDSGTYRFHGGHRLWAAPEIPAITYAPDDHPCHVSAEGGDLAVTAPADRAGLVKRIIVSSDGGRLAVDHTLANEGSEPLEVAPWAITQVPLGGTVLLPLGAVARQGLQASHSLVLWPYTDLSDSRLTWRERALMIQATAGAPLKVGSGPTPGRLGYLFQGHLFIKDIPPATTGEYPDRGAVAQVYVNGSFGELESVGPLTALDPGASVTHRELWQIQPCDDLDTAFRRVAGEAE
ncbi:MAG TPA: hypothetical protein VLA91_04605 [Acidimicrobiia bacterium]|nr:hypothetical protein [Acidimicrobiia bacterium]